MEKASGNDLVNNDLYHVLGDRWYTAHDHPIALLRAESKLRNPWIDREIRERLGTSPAKILDVGCGAGFLSNFLGEKGHQVTGVDLSQESLSVARGRDTTCT